MINTVILNVIEATKELLKFIDKYNGTIGLFVSTGIMIWIGRRQIKLQRNIGKTQTEQNIRIELMQTKIDARDILRRSEFIDAEARKFLIKYSSEINLIPAAIAASMYDSLFNYESEIYREFCILTTELQNKIIELCGYKLEIIDEYIKDAKKIKKQHLFKRMCKEKIEDMYCKNICDNDENFKNQTDFKSSCDLLIYRAMSVFDSPHLFKPLHSLSTKWQYLDSFYEKYITTGSLQNKCSPVDYSLGIRNVIYEHINEKYEDLKIKNPISSVLMDEYKFFDNTQQRYDFQNQFAIEVIYDIFVYEYQKNNKQILVWTSDAKNIEDMFLILLFTIYNFYSHTN